MVIPVRAETSADTNDPGPAKFDPWSPVIGSTSIRSRSETAVPLTGFSVRLTRVFAGSAELPTLDEARLQLMERVRASRLPIEVCTDCLIVLTGMPGECAQCGKRFAVMRVGGDTEIRRLEALVGAPKRPVTSLDRS